MKPTSYTLSQKYPHSEFLQVEISFENINKKDQESIIHLPAWRPGRYQLGNFSKNIRSFNVNDDSKRPLTYTKKGKDCWVIQTYGCEEFTVNYEVYTSVVDGGSTYVDEEIWYLNFINCMMYQQEGLETACRVILDIPDSWTIATSLMHSEKQLTAKSFYELVDSPVIAANEIKHLKYELNDIQFHLWLHGHIDLDNQDQIIQDFKRFSQEQLDTMGEFESSDYHFLFQLLDHKAYHGVEHLSSTTIVLGPAAEFNTASLYDNLLGISSHELFHYWNIIRIRPQEMFPYNFQKENYFPTGFVAEGITTYYGDLFLVRSGVKPLDWYLEELNKLFKRHFENYGRHFYSVADSSNDLWVDGYEQGTPNRKVSIYVKGAIIALILDLEIILNTNTDQNLDDVMRLLWSEFYKKGHGYSQVDYIKAAEDVGQLNLTPYTKAYIEGTTAVEERLAELLESFGFELRIKENEDLLARNFGLRTVQEDNYYKVIATAPDSAAEKLFRIGDRIISINEISVELLDVNKFSLREVVEFTFLRKGKIKSGKLALLKNVTFYNSFEILTKQEVNEEQIKNRKKWLKQ